MYRPFLNSISRTSALLGESSGFLVIMYRSAGACCWKTHKFTPFHTLFGSEKLADVSRDGGEEKRRMRKPSRGGRKPTF